MTILDAGKTSSDFPFDDEDLLYEEEMALPPIPDWPTVWTTKKSDSVSQQK